MEQYMVRNTVVRCGLRAASAAAILIFLLSYGDSLLSWAKISCSAIFAYLSAFDYSGIQGFFKAIGEAHFSIHIATAFIYGWLLCAWIKLRSANEELFYSLKYFSALSLCGYISVAVLFCGAIHQDGMKSITMLLLAVAIYVSLVISSISIATHILNIKNEEQA